MAQSTTVTAATVASDPTLESFAITTGIAQAGRRKGQSYVVLTMWANGRATLSKLYADDKTHLLSVLERAYASVEAWAEVAAPAVAAPVAAPSNDMAAMLAELARLQAENAKLAGAPVAAPTAAPVPSNATAARLSRIGRK